MDDNSFTKLCSLCDNILTNRKDMKKHMRTHSYKDAIYKCDICDFIGGDELDMDIDFPKPHGDKFQCGLCDYTAKDLKTLDTHLRTCEIYTCAICGEQILHLTNIKTHFNEKHGTSNGPFDGVRHIKQPRENIDMYNQQYH